MIDGRLGLICRHVRRCDYLFLQDDRLTTIAVILANERERCVCGMTNRRTNSKFRSIHRVFDVAFNFHKTLVFFLLLSFFFLFCFCIRVPSTFYMFTELYRSLKRTRPNEYAKKKKTKRSIGISSRTNYPRRWPRRLLDFSHKFFDWSVNDGDDKISIPPSMSHFQLCAYVASGAVATPCVAFIDPADTRRRRSGKVWNIDARIKHPCNFSPLFLFFLSSFSSLPSSPPSNQINLASSGEKKWWVAVVNF